MDGEWLIIDAGGGVVVDLDEESGDEVYSQRKVPSVAPPHLSPLVGRAEGEKKKEESLCFCQKKKSWLLLSRSDLMHG